MSPIFLESGICKNLTLINKVIFLLQGGSDDTAANFSKFKCQDVDVEPEYDLAHPPGHGEWGSYGTWSQSCLLSSAICGIQTKSRSSSRFFGDDTAPNDVKFYCCSE